MGQWKSKIDKIVELLQADVDLQNETSKVYENDNRPFVNRHLEKWITVGNPVETQTNDGIQLIKNLEINFKIYYPTNNPDDVYTKLSEIEDKIIDILKTKINEPDYWFELLPVQTIAGVTLDEDLGKLTPTLVCTWNIQYYNEE